MQRLEYRYPVQSVVGCRNNNRVNMVGHEHKQRVASPFACNVPKTLQNTKLETVLTQTSY